MILPLSLPKDSSTSSSSSSAELLLAEESATRVLGLEVGDELDSSVPESLKLSLEVVVVTSNDNGPLAESLTRGKVGLVSA